MEPRCLGRPARSSVTKLTAEIEVKKQVIWNLHSRRKLSLVTFAKLRKATIGFVISVRMSVPPSAWNNSPSTGRIFMKFDIWGFFLKSVEKIQVLLKADKNKGYFRWRPTNIFIISRSSLLRMRNVSDKLCRENQNTHFVFVTLFFPKILLFMRYVGKNAVQPDRS